MIWNSPKWVSKTPIITVVCLESANIGQLHRMWTEQTAEGQSILSWMLVGGALLLWWNFYRVITPELRLTRYCTMLGMVMNLLVILSVLWFRYANW